MGPEPADALDQLSSHPGKILAHQIAVRVSQHLFLGNVQHADSSANACGRRPQLSALPAFPRFDAGSFGQANHAGLDATLVRLHQRAAEGPTLVTGVGSKTHQPQWQISSPLRQSNGRATRGLIPGQAVLSDRTKASAMQRTGSMRGQRLLVLRRAVALVRGQAVLRIFTV